MKEDLGAEVAKHSSDLLSVAYKNAVDNRRAAWRVITSVGQKEKSKGEEQLASYAREYVVKVEGELQKIREGVLALMDKNLIQLASTDESKVLYYKMKSDYYRYSAEFAVGETNSKAGEDACVAYAEVTKITEKDLVVTHPICLAMDTKFLQSLKTRCSETNEEFDRRVADHQAELKAVIDAISILNSDTSFDTFDKTVSTDFLQVSPLAGEQALRQRALSVLRHAMNKVVDDPVVQVPQIQVVEKTVEPQLQIVKQIVETPETQTIQSSQTFESLGTAPVCQLTQAVDVPVVVQRLVPSIETVQKTVEVPQTQHIDKVVDVPVARPRQTPIIPKVQRTVETPRIQFMDRVVDVPVMAHSQTLSVQRVQKTVEVPQIQFIDKLVDSHVNMRSDPEMEHVASTLATECIASATGVTDTVATDSSLRKRKSSGSLQSPRVKGGTRTQVQDDDIRHEVFHVNIASADETKEAGSVHALTSKRTPSELEDVKSGVEHVKKDLKEAEEDA